jgi:hypothetical protein
MYNALQTIQAFEAGKGQRKERERERTMQGVGNALASGNYAGGAGLMFNMGDIQGGMQLQQYGKSLEDAEAEKKRVGLIKTGMGLLQTPLQNREAMRPQLAMTLQQFGVTLDEQQLAQMDLSDEGIKATLATLQDTDSLMAQYQGMIAPPEYGAPMEAVDAQDNPVFVQWSKTGEARPVEGYKPPAEQPSAQWEEYTPPGGIPGLFIKSAQTGEIKRVAGPQSGGIRVGPDGSVMIGGPVDGLGYGSGAKGQESAIAFDSQGNPVVTPSPQQEAYNKAIRGLGEFEAQNAIVIEDIGRALENVNSGFSTGAWAATKDLPIFGGITPAGELESLLSTIEANVGFDKLQAMREASPTGGALGSVTEKELAFLQAVFGSLRQDTRPENVRYNLQRLQKHMEGREQRLREAIAADFPSLATTAQRRAGANQQVQDLSELYEFMTPEERALFEGDQ